MKKITLPIIILIVVGGIFWIAFNSRNNIQSPTTTSGTMNESQNGEEKLSQENKNELQIQTTQEGTGPESKTGDTLSVHYTGTLLDGTKFDSSLDRGTPFEFTLGENRVIQGWEQGMLGMRVGEKRHLTIPADLAYGDRSPSPLIPANSILVFDVELLEIK